MIDEIEDLRDARNQFEKSHIEKILRRCGGNKKQAAKRLGIVLAHIYRKIEEFQIDETDQKSQAGDYQI